MKMIKWNKIFVKIINSPTSTVTWTLIFPLSFDAWNIPVDRSPLLIPFLRFVLLFTSFLLLSSNWNKSLSLPSGDRRLLLVVVSYAVLGYADVVIWPPYNGFLEEVFPDGVVTFVNCVDDVLLPYIFGLWLLLLWFAGMLVIILLLLLLLFRLFL